MKRANVGNLDRFIRVILGITLISYAATGGSAWCYIGIIPLLSGFFRYCPAYAMCKYKTGPLGTK